MRASRLQLANSANPDSAASTVSPFSTKSFACFNCATRKTKCDKERPTCNACQRRQLSCVYEDTATAGSRKRKATEDANGRLERFERILAQHGLTTEEVKQPESRPVIAAGVSTVDELNAIPAEATAPTGRLIVDENNSRYINSSLWREVENHGLGEIVGEDVFSAEADVTASTAAFPPASLSRGLLGATGSLLDYHPSAMDAARLWKIYSKSVEPLYKFLHTPSAQNLVETRCKNVSSATPADQCLLFAIYLLAVFSMNEDACLAEFGQARALLISKYDYSIRQALFNASWLSVSHMSSLLAFTGMGTRIMQRMGIHRDGESMGLRRFDVEVRRRLYWHLVSLDTYAGRVSGTSDASPPEAWDTKLPSNINDDQIYPDMIEAPCVRAGATDMIFSLVRIKIGRLSALESPNVRGCGPPNPAWDATEKMIDSIEDEIESEFLRYCDPVEPLHVLTLVTARAAIAAARLHQRMPLVADQTSGRETERREFYDLARRIMDTESTTLRTPSSSRLNARPNFFGPEEFVGGWKRISDFFTHHTEVFEARNILQRTIGRMTLMAWLANPPPNHGFEPKYITTLRSLHADSVAVAPPQHSDRDSGKDELNFYPSFEGDTSFDITMFLNSSVFGADSGWDGLLDGFYQ